MHIPTAANLTQGCSNSSYQFFALMPPKGATLMAGVDLTILRRILYTYMIRWCC
jgi:hypothetical protein